ncbi:ATP-binding protein [Flavobacterium sp. 83]|uniref:tetratricopeptide repeat-containing sensor histidine kinase n=1 Tax=Flavobacterium sp. 83 TaxID=1131812 RepID=UPI000551CF43|nr:ATP-binding protein [Flavobacterium sp. 83]
MTLKKLYFLIPILALTLFLLLQSCEEKSKKEYLKQDNTADIKRLINLGDNFLKKSIYDSSYYYFNKAKLSCNPKTDISKIIYSLSNLATIQQRQGDYSGSEATAIEAFPFLENTKNPNYKWNIYTILGTNYLYTSDHENAIYYYNKALNLKTDKLRKAGIKNNIAIAYVDMHNYKKAYQILFPLILKKEVLNDAETYSRIIDNLGYCSYKIGDLKGLSYLNQSLKIRKQKNDDWGMIGSYTHLSEFYKKMNPYLAKNYALATYEKATKLNSVDDRLYSLELLIQNSTENKSKKYSLLYLKINDSINKVRLKAKNQFAKIKYDSKKEKDENLKLKAQKILREEQQYNRNLYLYLGVLIIILTSIFITNFLMDKNKREKIKSSYNTEIRIAKKIHDELANDVFQTMSFAETQNLSTSRNKEILLTNLDTIYSRIRNISKENSTIESGALFVSHLKEMMSSFNNNNVNVLINGIDTINWITIESNTKITIYRVLQELLVNMKKHSQSSLVVISFKKNEGKLQIDYSDNGVGATFEKLAFKTGLQNMENRIHSIKGTILIETKSNKGFKVNCQFPM